jgi:hypothetical protein
VGKILENLPNSWVELTTHRLDIYDEARAKSQFLEQLTALEVSGGYDLTKTSKIAQLFKPLLKTVKLSWVSS